MRRFAALLLMMLFTAGDQAAALQLTVDEHRIHTNAVNALLVCAYPLAMDQATYDASLASLKKFIEQTCAQELKFASETIDPKVVEFERSLGMCGNERCVTLDDSPTADLQWGRISLSRIYDLFSKLTKNRKF